MFWFWFVPSWLLHESKVVRVCDLYMIFFMLHLKERLLKNCDYFLSFLDTSMKSIEGLFLLKMHLFLLSDQVEFPCMEHEFLNIVGSLKTLFENILGFKFYHLHFKEFSLLIDCENQKGIGFVKFKTNLCEFEKTLLKKDSFEFGLKDFVGKHPY